MKTTALNMRSAVLVQSGALFLGAGTFTPGADPNGFGSLVAF